MRLIAEPSNKVSGEVLCPGDKSISQRIVMLGSLLDHDLTVENFLSAADPISTMSALERVGFKYQHLHDLNTVNILNSKKRISDPDSSLNLGNSGTGLRLMLGFLGGLNIKANYIGDHSLSARPMARILDPLNQMGIKYSSNAGKLPINFINSIPKKSFSYKLPVASAQVKSSILLAGLCSGAEIEIVEPTATRDHTERMLEFLGAKIEVDDSGEGRKIRLSGQLDSEVTDYDVPGDFSSAAFLIISALITKDSDLLIKNVGINKTRSGLLDVLLEMGADIKLMNHQNIMNEPRADIRVKSSELHGINIGGSIIANLIDEIPILCIAASFASGQTKIEGAEELRVKESDRLNAVARGLERLEINFIELDDGIIIDGGNKVNVKNININSYHDHRIAMSFLIASLRSTEAITVDGCSNIETSFPSFMHVMNRIGLNIHEA
jgi:3-phosphoshikimate 1-carboxyvinyltransferase